MEWMIEPLRRYADFSGRSRRQEFWLFYLAMMAITSPLLVFLLDAMISGTASEAAIGIASVIYLILSLGLFLPMLAVSVRRLHDTDKSGWFFLLFLIPYAGLVIMLVLMVQPGTDGVNRFGPDPLPEKQSNAG